MNNKQENSLLNIEYPDIFVEHKQITAVCM